MSDMDQLRCACFEKLMRFPTKKETIYLEQHGMDKKWIDEHYIEMQIVLLLKDYQQISIDKTSFQLYSDFNIAKEFMSFLIDIHNRMLYKNPIRSDVAYFFAWLRLHGITNTIKYVKNWIIEQNEYKYQTECLTKLISWSDNMSSAINTNGKLHIRLYGPYGTTGYARSFRDIVNCLVKNLENVCITYVPMTVQEFNPNDNNSENILLSRLLESREIEILQKGLFDNPVDIILIHSVPDMWRPIVQRERLLNPNVRTIGMTVWETDHFPFEWQPHFYAVDHVTFPNRWNVQATLLDIPNVKATFVPHPVPRPLEIMTEQLPESLHELIQRKNSDPSLYIFYSVNEFSGRKGLDLLLRTYIREFTKYDHVLLFIKTHGSVKESVARELINRFQLESHYSNDQPEIIMDYSNWEDSHIYRLHSESHCFISLTRSEGHGLGACLAGLLKKRVIMTQYGGQLDYLKKIDWIPYTLVPASFCSMFDAKHKDCLNLPSCKYFHLFLPTQQNWAFPSEIATRRIMRNAYQQRLDGDPSTVSFLEQICNPKEVALRFYSLFQTTLSQSIISLHSVQDVYKQDVKYFKCQKHVLSKSDLICAENLIYGKRPHVTIIGCFYYGNVGDDLYSIIHQHMLSNDFDIHLINTTTYLSKSGKMQYIDKFVENDVHPTDYVVIGGGGLMNDAELSSSIFRIYFPYCKNNNIPISIISTGFGFKKCDGKTPQISDNVRQSFSPLLQYANLITVRSLADRDVAMSMVTPERQFRIKVLPDLVFGVETVFPPNKISLSLPEKYVVFCPTSYNTIAMPDIAILLQQKLWQYPNSVLVMLPMEGVDNPNTYPTKFVTDESFRLKSLFPDAIIYTGRYLSGDFLELSGSTLPSEISSQSLDIYVEIIRNACAVVTGRYHGLVLSRVFHKDVDTGSSDIVKITEELDSPLGFHRWKEHYTLLIKDIYSSVNISADVSSSILYDPDNWDEDLRNTTIVDLVTQTPPPSWPHTIPFIQSFSNQQLWRRKQSMLTEPFLNFK